MSSVLEGLVYDGLGGGLTPLLLDLLICVYVSAHAEVRHLARVGFLLFWESDSGCHWVASTFILQAINSTLLFKLVYRSCGSQSLRGLASNKVGRMKA